MTKQRIGVLVVYLLLAAAGVAQAPPAKQMAVEKKRGRGAHHAGDAGLGALDGHSRGSPGRNALGGDGRNDKNCGPTGRPDDRGPFLHASAFLHGRDKDCAALASDDGKCDGD